jgi:hypothetical protein
MMQDKVMDPDDDNDDDKNAVMSMKFKESESGDRMPTIRNGYGGRTDPDEPNHKEDFRYMEHR